MTDDLKIKQPQDPKKININEQWELNYWTKTLSVSEDTLKAAVKAVGVLVIDVKKHLGK
ncbi:DUF3606 domain-containing protein [Acinetobacter guillouiae]|uniref:DUF3606 domain-containing protein n=1 Tax=Acinetobacter guillouiae TaxID=106649 RepID=UPI00125F400C|nr:DUF3606 domain-containing protein [Acinetobacter guillouiae]